MKLTQSNFIKSVIEQVYKELASRGIKFRPKYYFSNEWGCPDRVPIIGIPYSYCYPIFKTFEEDKIIADKEAVLKILRHESGHALNYAFKLYEREDWKLIFGDFNKPYNLDEASKYINPFSKDFVVNLPDYNYSYASLHPDEDFSETFAVWISQQKNEWKKTYKNRPALNKLIYVDKLMNEIKDKKPLVSTGKKHKPYSNLILKGR